MWTQETGKQIVGALGARVDDVISRSTAGLAKDKPGQAANFGKPSLHAPKKKLLDFATRKELTIWQWA